MHLQELLRQLPSVDEILLQEEIQELVISSQRTLVVESIRQAIGELREAILEKRIVGGDLTEQAVKRTLEITAAKEKFNFRPVINGTGIVLHTNLGRAVLSEKAREAVQKIAGSYNNLEFDLERGQRGSRYSHVVSLLQKLTGCEDAMVVNNNAAAVLLVLDTLARDKEVIVSRGQLVEIGGSFRVPEVMEASGAKLVEVGTTNKTYVGDYAKAINENTGALLKVHTSNYRIVGFTHDATTAELVELGREKQIPVVEDLGSGLLVDLRCFGITDEPTVQQLLEEGVDIITFSGDKLLGGPQGGIIVGKKEYIDRMKRNPLTRALRVDKLTLAALEATLRDYLDPKQVLLSNPTLRMLITPAEHLYKGAEKLKTALNEVLPKATINVEQDYSQAGGGSLPLTNIPTYVVTIDLGSISEKLFAAKLRKGDPAVLVRVSQGKIIIDLRTLLPGEINQLVKACREAYKAVQEG
ncbi:MAG: L-seryl-tRNA(Sec) selenium transferase [Zhaonellaceae bacterium]|jgi:L-seryl-tRNA(Ser) seleniumtransferase|nr:L-seryl-tRNA(Sec) selenium transferase [Clostridia bacterium]